MKLVIHWKETAKGFAAAWVIGFAISQIPIWGDATFAVAFLGSYLGMTWAAGRWEMFHFE